MTSASPSAGSRAELEALGFTGFARTGQLHAERCEPVPDATGVFAIVRDATTAPEFMARSTAPVWRGMDPTRPADELLARWVAGAQVLFVARAAGTGVRGRLHQRIKRLLRFGHGRVVAHWSGRFVWQLRDHSGLRVAWRECASAADAEALEAMLLERFVSRFGARPFANDADDRDE